MKHSLLVFVLLFSSKFLFAQHFECKITTSDYTSTAIIDSTLQSKTNEDVTGLNWKKFYSNHEQYRLKNGNIIEVHIYSDSTILFEEFDSTYILLSKGELVVDSSKTSITQSDIPLTDSLGDPIIDESGNFKFPSDTYYLLVPNGLWYFNLGQSKNALVNYDNGVKHGQSFININTSCLIDSITISKTLFDHGIEITKNEFSLPSQKELSKLIEGNWYHPMCFNNNSIWVFFRKIPNSAPRNGVFSSTFKKGGKYEAKMNYSCGTGRSEDSYYQCRIWKIEESSQIEIGSSKYLILYITQDIMVLKEID